MMMASSRFSHARPSSAGTASRRSPDANRADLVEKEESELAIIMEYMPQQMTRDEISALVQQVIAEVGAAGPGDMGKVMSQIMPQVRGRAEGREVSSIAMETLRSL